MPKFIAGTKRRRHGQLRPMTVSARAAKRAHDDRTGRTARKEARRNG